MENLIIREIEILKKLRDSFELNSKGDRYYSNLLQILIPSIGTKEYVQVESFQKYTNYLIRFPFSN